MKSQLSQSQHPSIKKQVTNKQNKTEKEERKIEEKKTSGEKKGLKTHVELYQRNINEGVNKLC